MLTKRSKCCPNFDFVFWEISKFSPKFRFRVSRNSREISRNTNLKISRNETKIFAATLLWTQILTNFIDERGHYILNFFLWHLSYHMFVILAQIRTVWAGWVSAWGWRCRGEPFILHKAKIPCPGSYWPRGNANFEMCGRIIYENEKFCENV